MKLPPLYLGTNSLYSKYGDLGSTVSSTTPSQSGAWVANLAYFIPFAIPWPYPIKRFWHINAAASGSVGMDMGIYSRDGAKVVSTGSNLNVGVSSVQYINKQFLLPAGGYYFALAFNGGATPNVFSYAGVGTAVGRCLGIVTMNNAFPLPDLMVPAINTFTVYPLWGVTQLA